MEGLRLNIMSNKNNVMSFKNFVKLKEEEQLILTFINDVVEGWKQDNIKSARINHYEDEDVEFGKRCGRDICIKDMEELLVNFSEMLSKKNQ